MFKGHGPWTFPSGQLRALPSFFYTPFFGSKLYVFGTSSQFPRMAKVANRPSPEAIPVISRSNVESEGILERRERLNAEAARREVAKLQFLPVMALLSNEMSRFRTLAPRDAHLHFSWNPFRIPSTGHPDASFLCLRGAERAPQGSAGPRCAGRPAPSAALGASFRFFATSAGMDAEGLAEKSLSEGFFFLFNIYIYKRSSQPFKFSWRRLS